jgi:DNA-binding TFAR19-related protein (PDSD5 family)
MVKKNPQLKKHNVYSRIGKALEKQEEDRKRFEDLATQILHEIATPKSGQKYLELESIMKFPKTTTQDDILGKIIVDDAGTAPGGVIVKAKKEGRVKQGIQMWRVTSQITDEKFVNAFSQIPAFKKRIKVMP